MKAEKDSEGDCPRPGSKSGVTLQLDGDSPAEGIAADCTGRFLLGDFAFALAAVAVAVAVAVGMEAVPEDSHKAAVVGSAAAAVATHFAAGILGTPGMDCVQLGHILGNTTAAGTAVVHTAGHIAERIVG